MSKKETARNVANNWAQSMKEDPQQTKNVIRKMLQDPNKRAMVKKALKNRAVRWSLKKSGALATVEEELKRASDEAR